MQSPAQLEATAAVRLVPICCPCLPPQGTSTFQPSESVSNISAGKLWLLAHLLILVSLQIGLFVHFKGSIYTIKDKDFLSEGKERFRPLKNSSLSPK